MNTELARAFDRIADLMEITEADSFRINSYRRVARILRDLTDDIRTLHEAGVVREVKGIGKASAAKIAEYIDTGKIAVLAKLETEVPSGLPELLKIPGMGPKKVAQVHKTLGVTGMADLKKAIESGELQKLPGLGAQSVKRISDGIAFLDSAHGRAPLGEVWTLAHGLAELVRSIPGAHRVELGGSLRRGCETVGDLDILCAADEGKPIVSAFVEKAKPLSVLASGSTKGSITVAAPTGREIQVDLRVVPTKSFGAAWQYFTGSKEHNVKLRERAVKRGWKLNEWGLFDGEKQLAGADEKGIYAKLDLACPPPETREARFEFDDDFDPEPLISIEAIRGDLHMHTTASDGKNTIEQMAAAARDRGYKYMVITDHSRSSTIANGLTVERMRKHIKAVRKADESVHGITVLVGVECDILPDGRLDYEDKLLAECDLVIASIHSAMEKGKITPTERTLAAIENKYVSVIGHPSGRLIGRRPAMELDMARIVRAAATTHTALEINASWQRLDLKDLHARQAIEAGAVLAINTDAHSCQDLARIHFGIATARRAGVTADQVINTWMLSKLRKWLARKRS